jgi:hypothetical protein
MLIKVLLTDLVSVQENNSFLKLSAYLQNIFAGETHLDEGLTFAHWRVSEAEEPLIDLESTCKLTVQKWTKQWLCF